MCLVPSLNAYTGPDTLQYLNKLSYYYYCFPKAGLKSFQCDATAAFSGQLPPGMKKDWKGFDWKHSHCSFVFSYTGGEVMPILTLASNGGDPEATPARIKIVTNLANLLLLIWGEYITQPILGNINSNADYVVKIDEHSRSTIMHRMSNKIVIYKNDDAGQIKSVIIHDLSGTREIKLHFTGFTQGAVLSHAEILVPGTYPPVTLSMDVQYESVQGFLLPSCFTFIGSDADKRFQMVYTMANYQVQFLTSAPTGAVHQDSQVVAPSLGNPNAKHFLWRARSATATVYFLGSIHIRPDAPLQVPEIVEKSFESADCVGFEYDKSKEDDIKKEIDDYLAQHCTYPEGDLIFKHLTPEEWEKVRFLLRGWDIPIELAIHYKPYILSQLAFKRPTKNNAFITKAMGIDNIFFRKAQAAKKPVFGMEFWYEGFKQLDTLSTHDQLCYLYGDSTNKLNHFRFLEEVLADWNCGNTVDIDAISNSGLTPEEKDIVDKILVARNRLWMIQLDRIFQTHGTYFIVVGSAHLVGENGVPNLMKQKGYSVEQL